MDTIVLRSASWLSGYQQRHIFGSRQTIGDEERLRAAGWSNEPLAGPPACASWFATLSAFRARPHDASLGLPPLASRSPPASSAALVRCRTSLKLHRKRPPLRKGRPSCLRNDPVRVSGRGSGRGYPERKRCQNRWRRSHKADPRQSSFLPESEIEQCRDPPGPAPSWQDQQERLHCSHR